MNRFHTERGGRAQPEAVSPALIDSVAKLKTALLNVDRALVEGSLDPEQAQASVSPSLDSFKDVLQATVSRKNRQDLGCIRLSRVRFLTLCNLPWSTGRSRSPAVMQAATIGPSNCSTKIRPKARGVLGPLIDRWFLNIPSVRAVKSRRSKMGEVIREVSAGMGASRPCAVTSIASGPARELFDLLYTVRRSW